MSGEADYLIAADGSVYPLAGLGVVVTGWGDIPVDYQTTQGYGQHGHTVLDWRLSARTLNFQFGVYARDRRQFWDRRDDLLNVVRPNLRASMIYRRVRADGSRRDIRGWLRGGPGLEAADPLSFDAAFSLECPDPTFYDPTLRTVVFTATDPEGLGFPIGFPIGFASGYEIARASIVYPGSWRGYPRFTVDGPFTWLRIANTSSGAALKLTVAKSAGEQVILDLTPGALVVEDAYGVPRFDEIEGALTDWYLEEGKTSTVVVTADGQLVGTTAVTLTYYERYIAI